MATGPGPQIYQAFQHKSLNAHYKHSQLFFAPSSALSPPLLTQGKLSSSSPCAGLHQWNSRAVGYHFLVETMKLIPRH